MPHKRPTVNAAAVVRYRYLAGLTQTAASAAAKVSPSHLSNIEAGRDSPGPAVLARLAKTYGCTIADLLVDESEAVA